VIDSCSRTESRLLTLDAALLTIRQQIDSVKSCETVDLSQAFGRILARSPQAPMNLPQYRGAAMDGYALASSAIDSHKAFSLEMAGTSWAGQPFTGSLSSEQCLRIFTGALVPDTFDTVVMQEQVRNENGRIYFPAALRPYQNIKQPGEDIAQGALLIDAPKKLTAADMGLLASAGIDHISVKRRVKIAYLSTGDELVALGQPLAPGKIYDSNRYLLQGMLRDDCFSVTDLGIIADDKTLLTNALTAAAENHDVIISTGGASVGEADFIKEILHSHGQVSFWKLAIKPGKPLAFGTLGPAWFFGLPGNPVAVAVTFQQIVKPALAQLAGAPATRSLQLQAVCLDNLKKSPGRLEFMRGLLTQTSAGEFQVKSAGKQGSHILSALSRANCYIVLPAENAGVNNGDTVTVLPFGIDLGV